MLRETLRMRKALDFYADPSNYIDGVPMLKDDQDLLTVPDEGRIASSALGRIDLVGEPLIVLAAAIPPEEGKDGLENERHDSETVAH